MSDTDSSDSGGEAENFIETAIYDQLFDIFEEEFEEIGRFVAFTDANTRSYSTKIHELHLRVCSEVENVLKIVVHKNFFQETEIKQKWDEKKLKFLNDADAISEYKSLTKKLNSGKRKSLEKLLFEYPDFAFYYKLACEKFHLDRKKVTFKAGISTSNRWKAMIPFGKQADAVVPEWWTHYNKLKHDKVEAFSLCTLGDVGHAMGALYVLMNYLMVYQTNNYRIPNRFYAHFGENGGRLPHILPLFCSFNSKFFDATLLIQTQFLALVLPEEVTESQFQNEPATSFDQHIQVHVDRCPEKWSPLAGPLGGAMLDTFHWAENGDPMECVFYSYLDYEEVQSLDSNGGFRRLQHFAKFCN